MPMNRFSRPEFLLLNYLYSREAGAPEGIGILGAELELREKDPINRIRELVFHIEKLEREGYITTDPEFYTESDHMSFTYLNSAVELDEHRVRLSDAGRQLVGEHMGSGFLARISNGYRRIAESPESRGVFTGSCIFLFLLGLIFGLLAGGFF